MSSTTLNPVLLLTIYEDTNPESVEIGTLREFHDYFVFNTPGLHYVC